MYYVSHSYSDNGRAYFETDLITAEGEVEALYKDQCLRDGYADSILVAIDDVTEEDIEIDITTFIGDDAYVTLSKCLEQLSEEELTAIRYNSVFTACTMRRKR